MTPLIVLHIGEYDPEKDELIRKTFIDGVNSLSRKYDVIIVYGECKIDVYNIPWLARIIYKLKSKFYSWHFRRMKRRNTF